MTEAFTRLVVLACLGSGLVPLVTLMLSRKYDGLPIGGAFVVTELFAAVVVVVITARFRGFLQKRYAGLDANAQEQDEFLERCSPKYLDVAIVGAAALSLFLELAVIRWQGTLFEFFAFYKNVSLLSCFLGLGLGYALADRRRIPLGMVIPLLGWQFGLMLALRFGMGDAQTQSLRVVPFREQLNMGLLVVGTLVDGAAFYLFLSLIFLLTVLVFIPVGQLCGRLMQRRGTLPAYGLNLLGSLVGVVLMLVVSWLWTPPLVWFALCFLGTLLFYVRKPSAILTGVGAALVALTILAWPVDSLQNKIYSPYQELEFSAGSRGLLVLRAAGHYYQRILDLASSNGAVGSDPELKRMRDYYELPYRVYGSPADVAVVGSGTGNDVAAALRSGARHVDAIEIDPAILMLGETAHPEHPYQDRRVRAVVNDARSFLRSTDQTYDMIVYGLLDSHTLLSQASSVRLDSYVYTVEALREARARLKPGGVISLSFTILNRDLGRKIYLMMQQAFDGRPPVCIRTDYDVSTIFLEAKDKDVALPGQLLQQTGFHDETSFFANPELRADVSTDDWPFFYMPRRVYPLSYLVVVLLIVTLSVLVTGNFVAERPQFSHLPFFFLGAGFMLVETKGITELGLTFGNSWQVIGVVIVGILLMAFLGNCVVQWLHIRRPTVPYLLLFASLALGWLIARNGGLPSSPVGRLETALVLTVPMLFSGIVFSTLLGSRGGISSVMAVNLLGAMCGGLLEYNSMYLGFRALYLIAMGLYAAAFLWDLPILRAKKAVQLQPHLSQSGLVTPPGIAANSIS
jgi:SAM-dependent methyltransferase